MSGHHKWADLQHKKDEINSEAGEWDGGGDELIKACYDHIGQKHSIIWARFLIKGAANEYNRRIAAKWLAAEIRGVVQHSGVDAWQSIFSPSPISNDIPSQEND
jgi:hypothetical protein